MTDVKRIDGRDAYSKPGSNPPFLVGKVADRRVFAEIWRAILLVPLAVACGDLAEGAFCAPARLLIITC